MSVSAYIGPGLGAATMFLLAGLALSVLVAIVALLWFPLKRAYKSLRGIEDEPDDES